MCSLSSPLISISLIESPKAGPPALIINVVIRLVLESWPLTTFQLCRFMDVFAQCRHSCLIFDKRKTEE